MWASLNDIEPIDLDVGKAIRSSTTKYLLAKAWSEYIGQYKGDKIGKWKTLDDWKTKLHAQRLDPTLNGIKKEKMPVGKKYQMPKRKGTPTFRYPPGYCNEEMDDDEPDDFFLSKENVAGPKIKRESDSFSSDEIDALYDDADPPYLTSSQSSKRNKLDLSGRFSMRPSTPLGGGAGKFTTPMASVRRGTPTSWINKNLDVNE